MSTTWFFMYSATTVAAVIATWVIRGRVEARLLRERDAAEAAILLTGGRQWRVAGVAVPDPADTRWHPQKMKVQQTNVKGAKQITVLSLGTVIVSDQNEVYFDSGVDLHAIAEVNSSYAKEVIRCFRQRRVDQSTKGPS